MIQNPAKRILLNTSFLYTKVVITTLLSLYTTRLILQILGVEDFGLYNLIAGVITLLSFLNAALMQASQRFLSVYMGKNESVETKKVFTASILLHVLFSLFIALILEILGFFIFDGYLNIPVNKQDVAYCIYQIMILSTVLTVIGTPYNAIINAKEDLWFFAIVEVVLAMLKLLAVLLLRLFQQDLLIIYSISILLITLIGVLIKFLWAFKLYPEVHIKLNDFRKNSFVKAMYAFCGWNVLGSMAQVGRTQGTAVVLNAFGGVLLNAAYGISNQVNSLLVYFSQMMTASIAPQIMKAKGEQNIEKMIYLSITASKLSFFLSLIFAVPLIIKLPFILRIWLGNIPDYAEDFCYYTMCIFLILQLYPGLVRLLQADGHIKYWQITNTIFLLLPIPIGSFLLSLGFSIFSLFYIMIIAQGLTFLSTLFFAQKYVGLQIMQYLLKVVVKPILFGFISYVVCCRLDFFISNDYIQCILVGILNLALLVFMYYNFLLSEKERIAIKKMWRKRK